MNEERASREGPPRRSGGAGGGRRRAAAVPLDPADLATALRHSVAQIGTSGPPRAGLARIRRKAKARQRRRTVMAGGAGVMVMVMAVSVVTGNSFDIVPVLTSVVGLGGGNSSAPSGDSASPDGSGQVRTVAPTAGRKGPAIGPGDVSATPSALVGTGVTPCSAADLVTVDSVDAVIGGVSYGHVEAVAQHPCAVVGPPVLQVANSTANAASSVVLLRHTSSDGSQLPQVATWGAVIVLKAGQGYDFQFAWAPDACPAPGSSGAPASSGTGGTAGDSSGASPGAGTATSGTYQLSYLVTPTSLTSPVTLQAACGATVYVTDLYARGAFPLPKPVTTPSPQPTTASTAPDSPTPPATTSSSAPPAPPSSAGPTNGSAESPGAPPGTPVVSGQANDGSTGSAGQT